MRSRNVAACLLPALLLPSAAATSTEAVARGDRAYERRWVGHNGHLAPPGPINEAITAYEEALAADPRNQVNRTKLLRALFFLGDCVLPNREAKLAVFERGQILGEEGITQLMARTGLDRRGGKKLDQLLEHLRGEPHAAAVYYWAAVHWGLWGRHKGKIAAARQGIAGKIRDYAAIVIVLEPGYEDGGGHRMLGRLHAEAPKLPFVTGWVDRKRAISELGKAREYSADALTGLYFAEALLEYAPTRREEALEVLREVVAKKPSHEHILEELRAIAEARTLLEENGG